MKNPIIITNVRTYIHDSDEYMIIGTMDMLKCGLHIMFNIYYQLQFKYDTENK